MEKGVAQVFGDTLASHDVLAYKRRGACVSDTPGGEAAPFLLI